MYIDSIGYISDSATISVIKASPTHNYFFIGGVAFIFILLYIMNWRNKKMNKSYIAPIVALFFLGLLSTNIIEEQTINKKETMTIHGLACISKNGILLGCNENTVTDVLKNDIKEMANAGVYLEYNHLVLGNLSAPASGDTSHSGLITDCGLAGADATYISEGTGNWTLSHTWTSTCDGIPVNTTGVYNDTTSGHYGGGTTVSSTTVDNTDTVQVNLTRWIN